MLGMNSTQPAHRHTFTPHSSGLTGVQGWMVIRFELKRTRCTGQRKQCFDVGFYIEEICLPRFLTPLIVECAARNDARNDFSFGAIFRSKTAPNFEQPHTGLLVA